ncbi:MAG: extracellular solute-binding protein [Castellaniella sp.]
MFSSFPRLRAGRRPAVLTSGLVLVLAALSSGPALAASTDIQLWHSLDAHNRQVFETLVKQFNRQSKTTQVRLSAYKDQAGVDAALARISQDKDRPHLVQLPEHYDPDVLARRSYIQPLHVLMGKHPLRGFEWFLPAENRAVRDAKGRLLAFPYMLDIPVMYYNQDAFRKAGLQPPVPERSWSGLQAQLVTAANNGSRRCPLTSDQSVSVNLENLAAVNNQPYAKPARKGAAPAFDFDVMYIRHLSLMISWVRSELMVKPEFNAVAAERFAKGECAVLMSQSSRLGWFAAQRSLNVGIDGLPYYPEVTRTPGLAFVGGSALWATRGHAKLEDVSVMEFLGWLAQAEQAATWFEQTGFLPVSRQGFEAARASGALMKQWHAMAAPYGKKPVATAQGFQIRNYPEIRAMFTRSLDGALSGKGTAVTTLKAAAAEGSRMAGQK